MYYPAIITIARIFLLTLVVAALVLTATISRGFATSPQYWWDGRVIVGHLAVFCVLSFAGWLALAGPYHWARLNRGEEGVGSVWATLARSPEKFDSIRVFGPYLVAGGLTIALQQWITAPILHRLVPTAPFSATLTVVYSAGSGKGCSTLQLRDVRGADYAFCMDRNEPVRRAEVGSQVLVVGAQSWFGILGTSFAVQGGTGV
jgi:hypothetical protein